MVQREPTQHFLLPGGHMQRLEGGLGRGATKDATGEDAPTPVAYSSHQETCQAPDVTSEDRETS